MNELLLLSLLTVIVCIAGFRPGSRACSLARPEGRTFRLVGPVGHNLCVEAKGLNNGLALRDASYTDAPFARITWEGRQARRASQLAESILSLAEGLKQGSSDYESVYSEGRTAGVGSWRRRFQGSR